jgi:hypothetical protein
VAAFIHYSFLVRDVAPDMTDSILPSSMSVTESEMDSSELVEVSSLLFSLLDPMSQRLAPYKVGLRPYFGKW